MKEWAIIAGILTVAVFVYLLLFDHSGPKPKVVDKFENSKTGDNIKIIIWVIVVLFFVVATLKEVFK
tara:strand:- start:553 stop:753 length:201 start_codon:yes stop_codon:yes gene_type:complete